MPKTQSQIDTGQIITPRIGWLFRQTVPLPNFTWLLRKPLQIPKPFIVVLLPIATLCPPLAMPKKVCHPWQTTRLTQPPSPPPPVFDIEEGGADRTPWTIVNLFGAPVHAREQFVIVVGVDGFMQPHTNQVFMHQVRHHIINDLALQVDSDVGFPSRLQIFRAC
jgi:hypothetical protein